MPIILVCKNNRKTIKSECHFKYATKLQINTTFYKLFVQELNNLTKYQNFGYIQHSLIFPVRFITLNMTNPNTQMIVILSR